jgi:hypothetical protein
MADGVVEASTLYVGDLDLPYALVPVGKAANNVNEFGPSAAIVITVFTLVALAIALAYQQAIFRLARLVRRWRRRARSDLTEVNTADVDESAPAEESDLDEVLVGDALGSAED